MSTIEATHGWLQSTLSADQTQRRAAEEALKQSEFAAEHVVHLFRIAADTSVAVDVALRQAAAIRMKTVISRGWDSAHSSADGKAVLSAVGVLLFSIAALVCTVAARFPPACKDESVAINCPHGSNLICSDGSDYDGPDADHEWHHRGHPCGRHREHGRPVCSSEPADKANGDAFQTAVASCVSARGAAGDSSETAAAAACVADMGDAHADWCARETTRAWQALCVSMVEEKISPRCADGALPRGAVARVQLFLGLDEHWQRAGRSVNGGDDQPANDPHSGQFGHEHAHRRSSAIVFKALALGSALLCVVQLRKMYKESRGGPQASADAKLNAKLNAELDPMRVRLTCV